VWLRGAEIPAFARIPAQLVVLAEERTQVLHFPRGLVVTEEVWSAPAGSALEPEEDQNLVAANMVVHVGPVGVPDRVDAILTAAVARVGDARCLRVVRGGKCEPSPRGKKRLDLRRRQPWAKTGVGRRRHESARRGALRTH